MKKEDDVNFILLDDDGAPKQRFDSSVPIPTIMASHEDNSLSGYIFKTEDIIVRTYHLLKGHYLRPVVDPSTGKEVLKWITEKEDPTVKPILTDRGINFVIGYLSSNISTLTKISSLSRHQIAAIYEDIRHTLNNKLYENRRIFFTTRDPEEFDMAYTFVLDTVMEPILYILMAVENGRVFDRLTRHIEEMHQFHHEETKKGFPINLKGE